MEEGATVKKQIVNFIQVVMSPNPSSTLSAPCTAKLQLHFPTTISCWQTHIQKYPMAQALPWTPVAPGRLSWGPSGARFQQSQAPGARRRRQDERSAEPWSESEKCSSPLRLLETRAFNLIAAKWEKWLSASRWSGVIIALPDVHASSAACFLFYISLEVAESGLNLCPERSRALLHVAETFSSGTEWKQLQGYRCHGGKNVSYYGQSWWQEKPAAH